MEIVTTQPLTVGALPFRSDDGSFHLALVAKATFELQHGDVARLVEPYPLFPDVHHEDNDRCSLVVASDLVPRKPRADVLFMGSAYAPYGSPAVRRTVRLSVTTPHGALVDKSLLVLGERRRNKVTGVTTKPEPFSRVPMRYELAFGGKASQNNPVGVGIDADDVRLPCILYPMDARETAGLSPISPSWRQRAQHLAAGDAESLRASMPLVRKGLDPSYFNVAPADQQADYLSGHEEIFVSGLHLTLPEVRSRLPGLRATATIEITDGTGGARDVPLVADTLWIAGDTLRCCITWRGELEVTAEIAKGERPLRVVAALVAADPPKPKERARHGTSVPPNKPTKKDVAPTASLPRPSATEALPTMIPVALKSTQHDKSQPSDWVAPRVQPSSMADLRRTQRAVPGEAQPAAARPASWSSTLVEASLPADLMAKVTPVPTARVPGGGSLKSTMVEQETPFVFPSLDAPALVSTPSTATESPKPPSFKVTIAAPSSRSSWLTATNTPDSGLSAGSSRRPIEDLRRTSAHSPILESAIASTEAPGLDEQATTSTPEPAALPAFGDQRRELDPPPRRGEVVPLLNVTPLVVFTRPFQLRPPHDALVVVVKGTFDLVRGGAAKLAAVQEPPNGDVHHDDDPQASLRYSSDFAPFKPRADVMLVGTAYAGAESNVGVVQLRVGAMRRRLAVFGDRTWGALGPTHAKPFDGIPLRWERALGGALSADNPVGVGFKTKMMLPNLEDPDDLLRTPGNVAAASCMAPLHPAWRGRSSKLGTYGAKWVKTRWPYLPEDFDWSFFNAAPPTQQLDYLNGDEPFELTGVVKGDKSKESGRLDGKLPGLHPRAFVQKTKEAGGELFEVVLRLDTVWFDADEKKLVLVWRGLVETRDEEASEISTVFVTRDPDAAPLTLERVRAQLFAELAARDLLITPKVQAEAAENDREPQGTLSDAYQKLAKAFQDAESARRAPSIAIAAGAVPSSLAWSSAPGGAPPQAPSVDAAKVMASHAAGESLAGRDLTSVDLSFVDLRGVDLSGALLSGAKLKGAKLDGAKLTGATLAAADLEDASLASADLMGVDFTNAKLARADLTEATLDHAVFEGAQCGSTRFGKSHGERVVFTHAHLAFATFDDAKLPGVDFTGAIVEGASFVRANLDDGRFYDCEGMDVKLDEASLSGLRADGAKLPRASLKGAQAPSSMWDGADLTEASFERARLTDASFVKATLEGATLNKADATEARFRKAKMRGVRCLKTNLMRATFEGADLQSADLRGANLYQAETWKAKLTYARFEMAIVAGTKLDADA